MDVSPLIRALTQEILENREFTNLPRKVNVLMTGCPDNCLHAETQDLALIPAGKEISGSPRPGFNILVGGKLGSGGYRFATPLDVFRDHGSRDLRNQNRLAFLIEEWGEKRFRDELEKRLDRSLLTSGMDMRGDEKSEHIGIYRQKEPLMNYVGLKIPVGRIDASVLDQVAGLAEKYGNGEIRISPAQTLIIPNVSDRSLGNLIEEPLLKELVYHPSGIMKGLVSCVGSDYCHLAAIETKSRAKEVVLQLEQTLKETVPINMHWSGCPAGCGNHLVGDIGFMGKRARVGGQTVDAVDVFMGGSTGKNPKHAIKILENVPCDQLPKLLEGIIPYHTREKMHRVKGKKKSSLRKSSTTKSKIGKKIAEPAKQEMVTPVS
jgi:ferredoxin-nitrite reductase